MTAARKKVQHLHSEDWSDYILYGSSPEFVVKIRS